MYEYSQWLSEVGTAIIFIVLIGKLRHREDNA